MLLAEGTVRTKPLDKVLFEKSVFLKLSEKE